MGLDQKNLLTLFEKAMYLADIVIPQVTKDIHNLLQKMHSSIINSEKKNISTSTYM